MRTTEDPAYPIRELVGSQQPVWLYHLSLAVYPLGLYDIEPRTLLGQQAAHYPHPLAAFLNSTVVRSEPAPDLLAEMPGSVLPDEDHDLLAKSFELLGTPLEESSRYGTDGPAVDESQPGIVESWQVEPVAADGLRLRVVFGDRWTRRRGLLSSEKLFKEGRATLLHQHSSKKPTAQDSGLASATLISRSRLLFFFHRGGPRR